MEVQMAKKFVFIGAGSLDFTRELIRDILTFEAFEDAELHLVDIDPKRLMYARKGVERIVQACGNHAKIFSTTERTEALSGADGVLITILQGGVEVWRTDIEIPKKYGVDTCVGDTRSASGIFRFLRTAPVLLDIIRDCEKYCPQAIVLNYTNPMAMLVNFLQQSSTINVTGLCHSVQGTAMMLAEWLGKDDKDIDYTCVGINHQAFYTKFTDKAGNDLYPALRKALEDPEIYNQEIIRNDMFRHLDYYTTESSGHVSEYNWWYRKRPELIVEYTTGGTGWNAGEYGFILHEYLERETTWEAEYQDWLENGELELEKGDEYASNIFNAVFGDHTPFPFNGNLRNQGLVTNIVEGACVEVPVLADQTGIHPVGVNSLPDHLAILVNLSAGIEDLVVKAVIEKNPKLVMRAIMMDPLSSAVLSLAEIRKMVKEMFAANKQYLTYFEAVDIDNL